MDKCSPLCFRCRRTQTEDGWMETPRWYLLLLLLLLHLLQPGYRHLCCGVSYTTGCLGSGVSEGPCSISPTPGQITLAGSFLCSQFGVKQEFFSRGQTKSCRDGFSMLENKLMGAFHLGLCVRLFVGTEKRGRDIPTARYPSMLFLGSLPICFLKVQKWRVTAINPRR